MSPRVRQTHTEARGWEHAVAQGVGRAVLAVRTERGMSIKDVSSACEATGHKMGRMVISNLEGGKRESVSTAELLVLARALDVSPLSLLLPPDAPTEVAPGIVLDAGEARAWFVGAEPPRTITITVPAGAEVRMTS